MTDLIIAIWGTAILIWVSDHAKEIEERLDRIEAKMEVQDAEM